MGETCFQTSSIVARVLEPGEGGPAGDFEAARAEIVLQLSRIGGEVAERTDLDPLVTCLDDLVEETCGRGLVGVLGEPDPPGVGGGTDHDTLGHKGLLFERLERRLGYVHVASRFAERYRLADTLFEPVRCDRLLVGQRVTG